MKSRITPRKQSYNNWYTDIIKQANLAEHSATRGAMVIKPYGYALWEKIKTTLDQAFKATGHQNAYFPLLIPIKYFAKEAQHIEGFAKECAVVTHYRLKNSPDGKSLHPDPQAQLKEPLIVRPTSETIIWDHFRQWVQSYRDLPLLINQWANVIRWEMRTRLFLRTSEFLWQEGHTAHATQKEAQEEALQMLQIYQAFAQEHLAIPVLTGAKPPHERFAGAQITHTIEGLMQDGKALQMGTSHFLGQNFAKAFNVKFTTQQGTQNHVWGTSWGTTSRLIGAIIMTHADDNGLVLPPRIAPIQVVIIPINKKGTPNQAILNQAQKITQQLHNANIKVKLDHRDTHQPGWKFNQYERQGIPLRIVIGPQDLANQTIEITRRDTLQKETLPSENIIPIIKDKLNAIQQNLYQQARTFQQDHTTPANTLAEFQEILQNKRGFISAHWDGTHQTAQAIQNLTQATIRCIPYPNTPQQGQCIYSGKPSTQRVIFAQAY